MTTTAAVTEHTIRRDLRLIIDLWPGLATPAKDARAGGGASRGIPISAGALSLMREIPEQLVPWCRVLEEDCGADPTGVDGTNGAGIARWLLAWSRIMAGHDAAEDYGRELGEVVERMERCVAGAKVHRQEVGPCPEKIDLGSHVALCPGELVAHVRLDGEEESVVRCTVQPRHEWTAKDWGDLSRRVTPGGVALVTIREASALLDVPTSTIRRWVKEDRLQRYETTEEGTYRVDYGAVESVRDRLARVAS